MAMEINPRNSIIDALRARLNEGKNDTTMQDVIWLLFDTALVASGLPNSLHEVVAFGRFHRMIKLALGDSGVNEDNNDGVSRALTTEKTGSLERGCGVHREMASRLDDRSLSPHGCPWRIPIVRTVLVGTREPLIPLRRLRCPHLLELITRHWIGEQKKAACEALYKLMKGVIGDKAAVLCLTTPPCHYLFEALFEAQPCNWVLEANPLHFVVHALQARFDMGKYNKATEDVIWLLFDACSLASHLRLDSDPTTFRCRMHRTIQLALGINDGYERDDSDLPGFESYESDLPEVD